MNKFRLFRDLGFLVAGGFVLFGVFTLVNMYGGDGQSDGKSEFSDARRVAELSVKRQNWTGAVAANQKLTERDPFNSHAWYDKATASYQIVMDLRRDKEELDPENPDEEKTAKLDQQIQESATKSRDHFLACLDFARYRNRARIYLASLESILDDDEKALDHLELAVKDGFYNRQFRIGNIFRYLGDNPRFQDILKLENKNKNARPGFKRPSIRSR